MKLKYILPVATIASVAAAVTPLAISCGNKNTLTWTKDGNYKPMTPKEAHDFESNDELTVAYHDDLKANLKIWSDDQLNLIDAASKLVETEDFDLKKVSYTTTKISDIQTNTKMDFKFFRLDFNIKIDGLISDPEGSSSFEYNNSKITVKNFPLCCEFEVETGNKADTWIRVGSWPKVLENDDKWTVNMPEIIKVDEDTYKNGSKNKEYNNTIMKILDDNLSDTVYYVLETYCMCMDSNYYSLQTVGAQ